MTDPAIDAVLFDFDGTLAPNLDLPDMRRQVIALTEAEDVPPEVYADCYIVEVIDAACAWLNRKNHQARADDYYRRAHQLILDIELGEAKDTDPFPEVPNYLSNLADLGIATGVVTRNCRQAIYEVFPTIDEHIHQVCARDDVPHFKPDPRHLSHCLDLLGARPGRAAMVGDGRMDMSVGKALGMFCVGVCSGSSNAAELKAAGADVIYDFCYEYLPGQAT